MAEETSIGQKTRRAFVKTAAQVAVTAPAVYLLLSAAAKPAAAQGCVYLPRCGPPTLDDFTFGNTQEDFDAIASQSNTNPITGAPQQDDVWIPPPP